MSEKTKKSVVFVSYDCNNNCIFCLDSNKRHLPSRSTKEIKKDILRSAEDGATYLELIGGEVTIRKDALELIEFADSLDFETISLTTNGRMLAYPEYARQLVEAGLNSLVFSIHGHTAELHDHLTGVKGSFDQLMKGLENARAAGLEKFGVNTTIVKQNYKQLKDIGEFIFGLGVDNTEFIFVDPNQGRAQENFADLVPRISEAASYIRDCLGIGKRENLGHWHIRYVPLCYFTDYLDQISELDEVKKFQTQHLAQDFSNLDVESSRPQVGRVKGEQCRNCSLNHICEGIWKEYVKHYGYNELKPILKNN